MQIELKLLVDLRNLYLVDLETCGCFIVRNLQVWPAVTCFLRKWWDRDSRFRITVWGATVLLPSYCVPLITNRANDAGSFWGYITMKCVQIIIKNQLVALRPFPVGLLFLEEIITVVSVTSTYALQTLCVWYCRVKSALFSKRLFFQKLCSKNFLIFLLASYRLVKKGITNYQMTKYYRLVTSYYPIIQNDDMLIREYK